MAFTFFFEQYENEQQYLDVVQGKSLYKSEFDLDPKDLVPDFIIENTESYPKLLKVITTDNNEYIDIRLFHDYISVVQLIYSIFQSNEKYESYEKALTNQYFNALKKGGNTFGKLLEIDFDEFFTDLHKDYEIISELASKRNFLKITSGVKIESISKNSPLEIVFASSFFLLTLSIILSGGNLKVDATSKTLEIEIPNLASGLQPLIRIFKRYPGTNSSKNISTDSGSNKTLFDEKSNQ